jgi:hypothetical protein
MMFPSPVCLRALSPSERVRNFFRLGCETVGACLSCEFLVHGRRSIRAGLQTRRQSILHRKVNDSASITDRQRVNHHDHGLRSKKNNILACDITVLAHPLAQCIEEMLVGGRRLGAEERDARVRD